MPELQEKFNSALQVVLVVAAVAIFLAIASLLSVISWDIPGPTYIWRYKLTLHVEVDGQIYSGSSVFEISQCISEFAPKIRGEAVFVGLGKHGALIMTLRDRWKDGHSGLGVASIAPHLFIPPSSPPKTIWVNGKPVDTSQADFIAGLKKLETLEASAELPPDDLGALVTFTKLDDPTTLKEVDTNNLGATFGPGVKLLPATVEMTREPVTANLIKHLPWLFKSDPRYDLDFLDSASNPNRYQDDEFRSGAD